MDCWPRQTVRAVLRPIVPIVGAVALLPAPPLLYAKPAKADSPTESGLSDLPAKSPPVFADPFPSPPVPPAADLLFSGKAQTRADALARFAAAAISEEQDGPAVASKLYQEALALDPGNTVLAVRLARELLADEKPAEALRLLKDATAFAPDQPGPLLELARLYLTVLRRPDGALNYAEKAYKLAPDSLPVLGTYLDTCATAQLSQRVEDALKRVLQTSNTDPDYWLQAGILFRNALAQRNASSKTVLTRIQDLFTRALALSPNNPAILEAVSDHYALTQRLPEALAFYERASDEHRKQTGSLSQSVSMKWARTLLQTDQIGPAMQVLENLLAEHPGTNDAREILGELHLQQGQTLAALTQFRLALREDSSGAEDYLRIAQLQLRLKRPRDAAATAQQGRARFPENTNLTLLAAIALAESKDHAKALQCFSEAEEQFSQKLKTALDAKFYLTYGAAAERAGFPDRAAQLLQKSIDLDPENAAEALNYLGFMWVDRNQNLEKAGEMIRRALRLRPDYPAYLDSLGWWHFRRGEFTDALRLIQKALEKTPREESGEVYEHLGDILEKLSRKEQALEAWKTAFELSPELPELRNKIKKAQDNRAP